MCLELCFIYSGGNKYYCCSTSCWSEQGGWEIPLTPIWSVFCISEIIHIWIYEYSIPNYSIFCCRIRDNTFHSHTTSGHSTQNWTVFMESFVCGLSLTCQAMRRVHASSGTSSCLITLSPSQTWTWHKTASSHSGIVVYSLYLVSYSGLQCLIYIWSPLLNFSKRTLNDFTQRLVPISFLLL